jgi:hypothetical protein
MNVIENLTLLWNLGSTSFNLDNSCLDTKSKLRKGKFVEIIE